MFSIQLHVPTASVLGQRISLLQHIVVTAVVNALASIPEYVDVSRSSIVIHSGSRRLNEGFFRVEGFQSQLVMCRRTRSHVTSVELRWRFSLRFLKDVTDHLTLLLL